MDKQNVEAVMTRRQVVTGAAAVVAGVALSNVAIQAQPAAPVPNTRTRQVRVYVTDKELEDWTVDVTAAFAAGLPLVKVFQNAGAKTQNEHLQRFSQDAPDMLEKGYILSDLMEMNRHIFTRDYVITVRYGEIYSEVDICLAKWVKDRPKRD